MLLLRTGSAVLAAALKEDLVDVPAVIRRTDGEGVRRKSLVLNHSPRSMRSWTQDRDRCAVSPNRDEIEGPRSTPVAPVEVPFVVEHSLVPGEVLRIRAGVHLHRE
jgi:hypothetical protein